MSFMACFRPEGTTEIPTDQLPTRGDFALHGFLRRWTAESGKFLGSVPVVPIHWNYLP
jgi:hypothetical protein